MAVWGWDGLAAGGDRGADPLSFDTVSVSADPADTPTLGPLRSAAPSSLPHCPCYRKRPSVSPCYDRVLQKASPQAT